MKTLVFCGVIVALLAASAAPAASPTMVTGLGSSAACGTPAFDVCVPGADLFANFPPAVPVVSAGGVSLGLMPGDVVNSFSFGAETPTTAGTPIVFSVSPASVGSAGTAPDVSSEAAAGDAASDLFAGGAVGAASANALLVDGNGAPAMAAPASGLAEPGDDLVAFTTCSATTQAGAPVFYTLAPGSPTLAMLAAGPADVLTMFFGSGAGPGIFLPSGLLGLAPGDVIDALSLSAAGPPLVVSLAAGSPSLLLIGAGPEDLIVLAPPAPPVPFLAGAAFGLVPGDELDALDISPDADGDLVSDFCDTCPAIGNNDQADADGDGTGDACDPCPHVAGGSPTALINTKKVLLGYGGTGPGAGDDKPKVIKAEFASGAAFDPDSTDNVHVRLAETASGAVLFSADLTSASGLWTQPNPAKPKWIYRDASPSTPPGAPGVKKAILSEKPPGSGTFQFKMIGKEANIAPGFSAATDDVTLLLEIEPAGGGLCFTDTLGTCSARPTKDFCVKP
jgi:hypothetical protein